MVEFRASIESSILYAPHTLLNLRESYDSIVWKISGLNGSLRLFTHSEDEGSSQISFTSEWCHYFTLPGAYKTYLYGYKNKQIIYRDSASVTITNAKNFIGYNWSDVPTEKQFGNTGYHDALLGDSKFSTLCTFHNNIKGIHLFIRNKQPELSRKELSEYITHLYVSSLYTSDNKQLLAEKHRQLFGYRQKEEEPESIWITPTSKIVLLRRHHQQHRPHTYKIYAKPNDRLIQ